MLDDKITYFDLMSKLRPETQDTECHCDPDIRKKSLPRHPEWQACFGQCDSAQTHLTNEGVYVGDLFLFFGWFRHTKWNRDRLLFYGDDLHVIFGYMQIDRIETINEKCNIPEWMEGHPHLQKQANYGKNNTIYVGRKQLTWNPDIVGAGVFDFNRELVLTKTGLTRSKWNLPEFFKGKISCHSEKDWKDGYFQSAHIGQEFVAKDNIEIEK